MMSMDKLLARIQRKYQTVTETHAVGPLRLSFTRVADPDAVLDQIVIEEDRREKLTGQRREGNELHLPYWAELWDSAIGIAAYLAEANRKSQIAKDKSILDLGCGMGFAGMTAAVLGANVVFADLEPDALLFAQLNSQPWAKQVRARRLNWDTDRLDESFDVIIGSDVLYDKSQWESLERFFRNHIKPGGLILLGEPGRQTGDLFPAWISERGWTIDFAEQAVATRKQPIRIFRLRK
ncbi:MAG TPA: methyltransferase [Tepidisphaeraceae bacterium]|nr:methyltransferase [Tepidisphaeraceae bacterium]